MNISQLTIENLIKLSNSKNKWTIDIVEQDHFLYKKIVGINKGNDIWFWFDVSTLDNEEYLSFNHSYNAINGKTKKGLMYGVRQRMSLIKSIEKLNK